MAVRERGPVAVFTMSTLIIESGPITTVTLNRPEVRNAFDDTLVAELSEWARGVPVDGSVQAIVLKGAGPVFCAGADLRWMKRAAGSSPDENLADAERAAQMFSLLDTLPVPVIGRVQGAALGGGAGLAAVCDIVVAAEDAVFGFPETTIGLVPAMIAPYVVRKIGLSAAREVCLSGERFSAAKAREIGLAHDVVPAAEIDAAVERHVDACRRTTPAAVAATKKLLSDVAGRDPADVLALTAALLAAFRH